MNMQIPHDFDFEFGRWTVSHNRLKKRLVGSTDWEEFSGTSETRPILGGLGNLEDNEVAFPSGSYRAIALRSYDVRAQRWAIWWLDGRHPHHLDVPVIGHFADGVGQFFADDVIDNQPIKVRFLWLDTTTDCPRWEQAFSSDGGATWETNWTMRFERA